MSIIRGTLRRVLRREHCKEHIAAIKTELKDIAVRCAKWPQNLRQNRIAARNHREELRQLKRFERKQRLLAQVALDLSRFTQVHGDLQKKDVERASRQLWRRYRFCGESFTPGIYIVTAFIWAIAVIAIIFCIIKMFATTSIVSAILAMKVRSTIIVAAGAALVVAIFTLVALLLIWLVDRLYLRAAAELYILSLKYPHDVEFQTIEFVNCAETVWHAQALLNMSGAWTDSRDYLKQVSKERAS